MRPIDADEALRMMQNSRQDNPCSSASHASVWGSGHDCCISCVDALPTLDVVPREEVETGLPCVAYNKKHERYQVIHKGKQGHIFASKMYRNRREAEVALAELKKKYTEEQQSE